MQQQHHKMINKIIMNNKILMILVSIIYNKIIHYNYVNKVNKSHLSKYIRKLNRIILIIKKK